MTQDSRTTMELPNFKIQMLAVLIFLLAQLYPIPATAANKQVAHRRPAQRHVNPHHPIAANRLPHQPSIHPVNVPARRQHRKTHFKSANNRNRAARRSRPKRSRRNRVGGRRRRRYSRVNRNRSAINRTFLEAYRRRHPSRVGRSAPVNRANNQPKVRRVQSPFKHINPRTGNRGSPVKSPAPVKPVNRPKPRNPPPPKKQLPVKSPAPVKPVNMPKPKNSPPPKKPLPVRPINPPTKNVPVPIKQSPAKTPSPTVNVPKTSNPVNNIPVGNKQSPINPPTNNNIPAPTNPSNNVSPPNNRPADEMPQISNRSPTKENTSPLPPNNQPPPEPYNDIPNGPTLAQQSSETLEFLVEHNKVRTSVSQPFYVWDKKLEDFARSWANQRIDDCKMIHSDGPYGENIFWGFSNQWTAAEAVRLWAEEREYYNPQNNSCQQGKACGHYTQIVWRDSKRLGCARIECRTGGVFIICAYDPSGNYEGESPFDIHEP